MKSMKRSNHNTTLVRYCSNCRAYIVSIENTGRCQDCGLPRPTNCLVEIMKPSSHINKSVRKPGRGEV